MRKKYFAKFAKKVLTRQIIRPIMAFVSPAGKTRNTITTALGKSMTNSSTCPLKTE